MNIDELVPSNSKFLTKDDVGEQGKNLTIAKFSQAEVKGDTGPEAKAVLEWREQDVKPMILNKENATRLKVICKTSDTDQMVGATINVYNDPFITFGGRQTGGIRIRPAQGQPQQAQPPAQESHPDWQPTPPPNAYENEPNW